MSQPLGLRLYALAMRVLAPLAPVWLQRRAAKGKEEPARLPERFGHSTRERPEGGLVWLHGASVGESLMLLQIVRRLGEERENLSFLITTGTATSAALVEKRKGPRTQHQYIPLDAPAHAERFLDHWRPDLAVFAESEIWPNLIQEAAGRGIPLALVNARMNAATLDRWARRAPRTAERLFNCFRWIGAADEVTAAGLSGLTGRHIDCAGNLKLDAEAPPVDLDALTAVQAMTAGRPAWLAASTHEGEEEIALAAHARLLAEQKDALLILAPRHPERRDAVIRAIRESGLSHALRSRGDEPSAATAVYLADTLGELGLFFRAAPVSLIAGSLAEGIGGHNPVEAAQCGCALIAGPHAASFADLYAQLDAAGGVARVRDAGELALAVSTLLSDDGARRSRVEAASSVVEAARGAMDRTLDALRPLLPARGRAA